MKQKAAFLDRDGTLIVDTHYPKDPELVSFLPGVPEALRSLQEKGYLLFVVSNQSGVGRGLITPEEFQAVHDRFCALLESEGIKVQEFAYCFHRPDEGCQCRKPGTKLVEDLIQKYNVDIEQSFFVGDKESDLETARRVGMRGEKELTPPLRSSLDF